MTIISEITVPPKTAKEKLELSFIKGPLSKQELEDIARLYGHFDANYRSLEFCDYLFNKNPFGYSFHAFLVHPELGKVGHYGMIPVEIMAFGKKELSVKGEAFFVVEACRTKTIEYKGKVIPVAFALSVGLTDFVIEHGISIHHLMSPKNVARIHQRGGCKEVKLTETSSYYFNTIENTKGIKRFLKEGLALYQAAFYKLYSPLKKFSSTECLQVKTLNEVAFGEIVKAIEALSPVSKDKWSIYLKGKALEWHLKSPTIHVVKVPGKNTEFALLRKHSASGKPMEILAWICPQGFSMTSVLILQKILEESKKHGSPWLRFSNEYMFGDAKQLKRLSKLFGFMSKKHETFFYVKSDDPLFKDSEKVLFNPCFYINY